MREITLQELAALAENAKGEIKDLFALDGGAL